MSSSAAPRTRDAFANAKTDGNPDSVPAVALQKFLALIQAKRWEPAKALAFQSKHRTVKSEQWMSASLQHYP